MGSLCCSKRAKQIECKPLLKHPNTPKYKSIDSVNDEDVSITINDKYNHVAQDELLSDESFSQNSDNENECNTDPDNENPMKDCIQLKRIVNSLRNYEKLNITDNKQDLETFIQLTNQTHQELLDDYIHLNNYHSKQLQNISKKLEACNVSKCQYTSRHYRNIIPSTTDIDTDAKINFYSQIMDSLHFYLHHCFDVGLRVRVEETDTVLPRQDEEKDIYFDVRFSRINTMVSKTSMVTKQFDRFSKDNKYTIKADNDHCNTYLDELCQYIRNYSVTQTDISMLVDFIHKEEYETESVEYDVNITENECGNISNLINNCQHISAMQRFFEAANMSLLSFNIGLRFYYWDYYKTISQLDDDEQVVKNSNINNYNDHSGYDVCDL
eukprot:196399_1